MIYSDGIHIITDGPIEELHAFAVKAKIKRQNGRRRRTRYVAIAESTEFLNEDRFSSANN